MNIILITGSIYGFILTHIFYINTNRITCSVFKLYDHLKNGDDKTGIETWKGIINTASILNKKKDYLNDIQEEIVKLVEKNSFLKKDYLNGYIQKIESCRLDEEHKQLKEIYESANNDETEALKIQMQLRDRLNELRNGEVK